MKMLTTSLLMSLLFFVSCGADPFQSGKKLDKTQTQFSAVGTCSCTYDYNPVCGANGVTYDNACISQCNNVDYTSGACSGTNGCNVNSGVICAQPPMQACANGSACAQVMPNPKTYSNDCARAQENASYLYSGSCTTLQIVN